jgi:hypothetical protein
MGYDTAGNWSPFDDLALPLNTELLDFGDREVPSIPVPAFDGHQSPCAFTTDTGHTDSATVWYKDRRELRLYCVRGVVGQFISALDLKDAVGKCISEHGGCDVLSLVFNQNDISANCQASMNLRSDLSRWGFRRDDSFNGHGLLFTKDLRPQEAPPTVAPKPAPVPTTAEEWAQRYKDEGLKVMPPSLQKDLAHEKKMREDAENDPYRKMDELQKRIAELNKLKAESEKTMR